jgi:hypothetical protein
MKKIILNLLFALITTLGYSQVPNYVPTNGLVGWWPFNGNAYDESGNGNNGFVNGATLTSDRNGVANQAYTFDVNQKIGTFITNFPVYSVSIWAKINTWNLGMGTFNGGALASHKTDGFYGNGWGLEHNGTNNQNQWSWFEYNGNNSVQEYVGSPQLNTWFHIVFTSDSQGARNLFINGVLTDTYNGAAIISGGNNYEFKIGALIDGQTIWWFKGDLDDVGYWNRALTECEIQNLYTSQINSTFVTAGADQTICNGEQVTLSASNSQNYSWNNGVIDSVSFSPTTTQDYIVTADSANCQSSDTVTVFVNESTSSTQTQTALDTYTWPLNNQTYTQGGTYTATIPNAAGCDSVVTLNLTLNYTGINELIGSRVSISPNPTSSKITVKSSLALIGKEFTIYDQQGKVVKSGVITAEETEIDLSNLSEGIYLFKAGTEMQETFKIIKQ